MFPFGLPTDYRRCHHCALRIAVSPAVTYANDYRIGVTDSCVSHSPGYRGTEVLVLLYQTIPGGDGGVRTLVSVSNHNTILTCLVLFVKYLVQNT